ncbi:MAG: hypothetical protein ACLFTK_09570 [Anaerolineales bacterium]
MMNDSDQSPKWLDDLARETQAMPALEHIPPTRATIRDRNQGAMGYVEQDGEIRERMGKVGSVDDEGVVRDRLGILAGHVAEDGTIRNRINQRVGFLSEDGKIRVQSGRLAGTVKDLEAVGIRKAGGAALLLLLNDLLDADSRPRDKRASRL